MMKTLLLFSCILGMAFAHREYMDRLPNGHKAPNPCKPDSVWEAMGHSVPTSGHHGQNKFGEDFKKHGHKHWNRELCQMDSDGDGVTNGAELGDPDCTWTPGKPIGPPTGHPGICEPLNSAKCGHSFRC